MKTKEIFSEKTLTMLNVKMIGRGAPDEKDDIGYNSPDYAVCRNYFFGLSYSQLADLAERLIKYCDTQLNLDVEKMMETKKYYRKLAKEQSHKEAISVEIGSKESGIYFSYNQDFIEAIKKVNFKKRYFDGKYKCWRVNNFYLLEALQYLKKVGAEVDNAIKYAKENLKLDKEEFIKEENTIDKFKKEKEKIVIKVFEVNRKKIQLSFKYKKEIVEAIRTLFFKNYDGLSKRWTINKKEIPNLLEKISPIEDVVFDELVEIMNENLKKEKEKNVLIDYSYLERKPFKHQIVGAQFLLDKRKAILGDTMGLGKTFTSILAMNSLKGKKLIVCPASLKLNWKKEIKMVSNGANVVVIDGKKWLDSEENGWTVVNYDILNNHLNKIKKGNFRVAVFDEVHYCKAVSNSGKATSKRAKNFLEIVEQLDFTFLLTGTPITNKTKDIFNLLVAVEHPLSYNFFEFGKKYCSAYYNGFGWSFDGSSNQDELNEKLKPYMLRRLKEDTLDLPNKLRTFIPVEISTREYMKKVNEYMEKRNSFETKGEHLVYLNAMRHILAKEKIKHTKEIVQNSLEQGKPIVVFTNYNIVVDVLKKEFPNCVTITGKDNKNQRQNAVDSFQEGKTNIIVCNLIAGGVGLTLTRAKNMLIQDFDWLPSNHTQAEDRIHRIGQNEDVFIQYLYSEGTIDEKMADLLESKLININKIIDGKEDEGFVDNVINWF